MENKSPYSRKTIYFKADNADLYEYIESLGKGASDYICNLIRADLERDKEDINKTILNEVKLLRNDLKHLKIEVSFNQTDTK